MELLKLVIRSPHLLEELRPGQVKHTVAHLPRCSAGDQCVAFFATPLAPCGGACIQDFMLFSHSSNPPLSGLPRSVQSPEHHCTCSSLFPRFCMTFCHES